MKKIFSFLSIICVVLFLSSCTNQEKAERAVKDYLKEHLNDPGSYEAISFTTLRLDYDTYEMASPEYKKYKKIVDSLDDRAFHYYDLVDSVKRDPFARQNSAVKYQALYDVWQKREDSVLAIIKAKHESFKGPLRGYSLDHKYRAKNAIGGLVIQNMEFNLDKDLNVYAATDVLPKL